jgi:hypothetical protein
MVAGWRGSFVLQENSDLMVRRPAKLASQVVSNHGQKRRRMRLSFEMSVFAEAKTGSSG